MNFTPFTTSKKAADPNSKYTDSFCLLNIASTPTNVKRAATNNCTTSNNNSFRLNREYTHNAIQETEIFATLSKVSLLM